MLDLLMGRLFRQWVSPTLSHLDWLFVASLYSWESVQIGSFIKCNWRNSIFYTWSKWWREPRPRLKELKGAEKWTSTVGDGFTMNDGVWWSEVQTQSRRSLALILYWFGWICLGGRWLRRHGSKKNNKKKKEYECGF